MRFTTLLVLITIATKTYSQQYTATYDYNIQYDIAVAEKLLKENKAYNSSFSKIGYTFSDSSTKKSHESIPDSAIQNYFLEYRRRLFDDVYIICVCSPKLILKRQYHNNLQYLNDSNTNTTIKFKSLKANTTNDNQKRYSILDISKMKLYKDIGLKPTCYSIKTSNCTFSYSGKTKKINNWVCKEYKSESKELHDISIWASVEVPSYINPQVYVKGVYGGIVSIQFNNKSSITLRQFSTTNNYLDTTLPSCTVDSSIKYDLFDLYIRKL